MSYLAHIVLADGSQWISKFKTPGRAMDYVTHLWESGYFITYGEVYKCTRNCAWSPIWSMSM